MSALLRTAPNPTAFPEPLVLRVIPRWELYKLMRYITLPKRNYGVRGNRRLGKSKRQMYELMSAFSFRSAEFGTITVPKGFLTDFGSVPYLTKPLIDNDDADLLYGSQPHDYLYSVRGQLPDGRKINRKQADGILAEAMRACGAPELKIAYVYRAVRVGNIGAGW